MSLKTIVDSYLENNFTEIQKVRKENGFSWKPIVNQINKDLVDKLDPEKESDRDYVRNRFLAIRRNADIPKVTPILKQLPKDYSYLNTYTQKLLKYKTDEEEFKLWKEEKARLQNQVGLHVVAGCIHFPAVNTKFYAAFLQFLSDLGSNLKGIHLIGDIIDCKSLSSHDKGQVSNTTLEKEYSTSNLYLDRLDSVLPHGIEKNYIWGNHEERYTRILKQVDTAKFGKALLSPTAGCRFIERGYTVQEDYMNAKIQLGKYLDLIHGQYVTVNSTKKHLDVYKKSIMFAHTHKMGSYFDTDKASFNIGWMGDSNHSAFNYCSRVTKEGWQNGFAVVNIDSLGFYHVQLVQWYNGRFYFGGKEYRA